MDQLCGLEEMDRNERKVMMLSDNPLIHNIHRILDVALWNVLRFVAMKENVSKQHFNSLKEASVGGQ
jgi:hypothetical protein